MGRLDELRKEIEQLCEEIQRDTGHTGHRSETADEIASPRSVHIHLVVSGDLSSTHIRISVERNDLHDSHEHRMSDACARNNG
ncbi:hypothetical protein [Burkholderia multivorans]|uniref:hypothetical protein n=1 Tax=Burkholderia multivorans TaxID=87883 RepID=UPI001C229D98|nr:hypothetical protein [Burkholderia multivorans]MBU9363469.1 hypothetical protein [Burkholderia multivorans]